MYTSTLHLQAFNDKKLPQAETSFWFFSLAWLAAVILFFLSMMSLCGWEPCCFPADDFYSWSFMCELGRWVGGRGRRAGVEICSTSNTASSHNFPGSFNMYWSCSENLFRKTFPKFCLLIDLFSRRKTIFPQRPTRDQEIRVLVGLHSSHSPSVLRIRHGNNSTGTKHNGSAAP